MNIDLQQFRNQFPVTRESVYINHAGTGPMSLSARRVIESCLDTYACQAEFPIDDYFERVRRVRQTVATFIGADQEEITLTHNTSEGIFIALMNVPLQPDDVVLVMDEVFPAARYAVDHNLPGLKKQYVPFSNKDPVEVIKKYLGKNLKAVVVDLAQYLSGEMINIKRLSSFLKDHGIFCIVDGIQVIGTTDFCVHDTDIDFLSCGAAKWLFGPSGAGFLYINRRNFPILKKIHTGWLGAQWKGFEDCQNPPPLYNDARMFEQGTRNIIGVSAMSENLQLLMRAGLTTVAERIQEFKKKLREAFQRLDYEILTPENDPQSGIITARPRVNTEAVFQKLIDNRVVLSLRSGWLRFSPHFYNSEEEIDTVISLLGN